MDISIVALIASIVSICLAFFAIWQANHHRDKSDKLNRDTTEKLARIESSATSTKEDAFAEIRRWGDFARAGGKRSEEAEKAKEEEMKKLKDEIQATTSEEINKVLQTVESKISSSTGTSTISEIKKEFEELKKEIGKIQEKGLGEVKRIERKQKFERFWLSLPVRQRDLLAKAVGAPIITFSIDELEKAEISTQTELHKFIRELRRKDVIDGVQVIALSGEHVYQVVVTSAFREFLKDI